MKTLNTQRTVCSKQPIVLGIVLSLLLVLSCAFAAPALAVTSAEKYAEAEAITAQIDSLQTELNQANAAYETATSEHARAEEAMNEAQERIEAAEARIEELQGRLGKRVNGMYKQGSITFLDVILQASTFDEFLTSLDMVTRINEQDADLVQETKDVRAEANAAHAEFKSQKEKAAVEMQNARAAKDTIATTQSALQAQVASISAEAAALAAEETAAAEAAAHAAEAAAAAAGDTSSGGGSNYNPGPSHIEGHGILNHPCPGASLSSLFGPRWGAMHNGIDLAAGEGTPYYAAEAGTVIYATYDGGWNGGAGNWIVLSHGNGMSTVYMHSSAVFVKPGQQVARGENIGAVGNTGDSYGAHLHFEVKLNGTAVNPLNYL